MAIFHFTTEGAVGITSDTIEVELDGVRAAQIEAVGYLGEILRDRPAAFWADQETSVIVTDANGLILFRLDLTAVLAPSLRGPALP